MKKLRIILLTHASLVPPDTIEGLTPEEVAPIQTEYAVYETLRLMGHTVWLVGVSSDLSGIKAAAEHLQPDIAFNLLEEFDGIGVYDAHVVSYLEMIRLPYTGCNPRGLMLAHNKAIAKMVCKHHRLPVPDFAVAPIGRRFRRPRKLEFPLFVKSLTEEGSVGIAQASVVHDDDKLADRVAFIHEQIGTDAIVERYIEGRELYVGTMGNDRLQTFPIWEIDFGNLRDGAPRIATSRIKWDERYQKKLKLQTGVAADLPEGLADRLPRLTKRIYKALMLSGYARLDYRLAHDGRVYLLEANPNPQLMYGEDFAESADAAGLPYEALLQRILNLGIGYRLIGQR